METVSIVHEGENIRILYRVEGEGGIIGDAFSVITPTTKGGAQSYEELREMGEGTFHFDGERIIPITAPALSAESPQPSP